MRGPIPPKALRPWADPGKSRNGKALPTMVVFPSTKPQEAQLASQYAKGDGGAKTSYAAGGPPTDRSKSKNFEKVPDTRFTGGDADKPVRANSIHYKDDNASPHKAGRKDDFKYASLKEATANMDSSGVKLSSDRTEQVPPDRLGGFLGGSDRFTSQNFAEQGAPANVQRIKPDEDWSKEHVPMDKQAKLRFGDHKLEAPRTPRKAGAAIKGR